MTWAVEPFSLWWYRALGVGSQQSFMLATIRAVPVSCQKACDQWRGFDLQSLPPGPLPFLPMGHLTHPLQCTGVGYEPVWFSHTPCHFFISNKLTNIEDGWSRWAVILPVHLDVPPPCHKVDAWPVTAVPSALMLVG